jgi:hypothetical protein
MLHLTLLRVATDLPIENFSFDIRVMEHGGDGAWRATGAQGMAARWGMATRRGTAAQRGQAAHGGALVFSDVGARSFYCIG